MPDSELKPKVFISCGQRTPQETDIAERIRKKLLCEGYDAYVAVQQQTLRDLQHNIFNELDDSEYIVFVDFKREALVPDSVKDDQTIGEFRKKCQWRGSLFCHQELAVASYLEMTAEGELGIVAFHQKGLDPEDGMMGALQVNSKVFEDPDSLPERVAAHAREKWKREWRNQLRLERVQPEPSGGADPEALKFFHIGVNNSHYRTGLSG